jgi:hypothetical protein
MMSLVSNLGNVAEWVAGIGTVTALFFAGFQIRRDRISTDEAAEHTRRALAQTERALAAQADRDDRDLRHRERVQAALVSCETQHGSEGINVDVMNFASTSIFEVRAFVRHGSGLWQSSRGQRIDPQPPAKAEARLAAWAEGPRIETGVTTNRAVPAGQHSGVTFRDNDGRAWIKWGDGVLIKAEPVELMELSPADTITRPEDDPRNVRPSRGVPGPSVEK